MMNVKKSFSKKNYIKINIVIVMILLMSAKQVYAVPIYSRGNIPIVIDGYFDDWSDKPYSWEYVWDNPDDYWENGGEDKEIDNYVDGTVEYYDDWSTWEELNW